MDIHRCRFVPYQPHSINAVAFSHASNTKKKSPIELRLAVGRSNGDIEIWNPQAGKWVQETIFRGERDKSIEGLVWTRENLAKDDVPEGASRDGSLRLFSINNSTSVTEWDLALGTPKRHASGNLGDLWCFAAQPLGQGQASDEGESPLIAAGSESGSIVIFSTEENELRFNRILAARPAPGAKVLSITWKDRHTVVAGYDKSRIQVYDVRNKSTIRVMSLGKPAEGNETFVWCLRSLPDGTILSGDSSGELKVWDAQNYSLVQRLKTHQSHIMDITASTAGDMIASVGVDRRTVYYQPAAQDGLKSQRWTQSMHRRFHQHDVKTIAAYESSSMSVIVSGGVDAVPVVAPLKQWQNEHHRALPHLPQKSQMSSSSKGRLMLTWWEHEVCIWRLPRKESLLGGDERLHDLVARLAIKDEKSITSAQISNGGEFVLLSTTASAKLFQLRTSHRNGSVTLHTRKIRLPPTLSNSGARSVSFSPSGQWLCVVKANNTVCLAKLDRLQSFDEKPIVLEMVVKLHRKPRQANVSRLALGSYSQAINCVAFSGDSRILTVGDLSGAVDAWVLEGHEDFQEDVATVKIAKDDESSDDSSESDPEEDEDDMGDNKTIIQGQRWERNPNGSNLPRLNSAILALAFRASSVPGASNQPNGGIGLHATRHTPHPVAQEMPSTDDRLVVVTAEHQIVEFEVLNCRFSDWSRRNPANLLPSDFTIQKDRAMGIMEDPSSGERLWVYGTSWLFMLDMSKDLHLVHPKGRIGDHNVLEPLTNAQKKRKRKLENSERRPKRNTGAGDEIPHHEAQAGFGKYSQKFAAGENTEREVISIARMPSPASDDELEIPSRSSALAALRRQELDQKYESLPNGNSNRANGITGDSKAETKSAEATVVSTREPYLISLEYRNVFGMATIGGGEHDSTSSSMEVVIIERPMFDVDLPPRYDGGQDW
jgi:U3 small nucleolar RNA-associated protein 4